MQQQAGTLQRATSPLVSGDDFGLESFLLEHLNVARIFQPVVIKVSPPVPP